jgi:hypothetical protein
MAVFRGRIVSFDDTTHTAQVRVDGSVAEVLDLAVSRAIAAAEMVAARAVLVDTGETHDPADFVVTAVWG